MDASYSTKVQEPRQLSWSLSDALFEGLEQSAAMRKLLGQALKERMEAKTASETCDNCSASCAAGSLVGPSRMKREPVSVTANSQDPTNPFVSGLPTTSALPDHDGLRTRGPVKVLQGLRSKHARGIQPRMYSPASFSTLVDHET